MSESRTRYDLLRPRLKRFTRMLQGLETADARAVHQTRVASRRLRELLPVLQLEPGTAGKLVRRLRRVTRALGPAREADVLLQLIDERKRHVKEGEAIALVRLAEDVQSARDRAAGRISTAETLREFRRVSRKLERMARMLEEEQTGREARAWHWVLEARAARRAETLRLAMNDAGAVYLAERLHVVRIALKKLRYSVELIDEAAGKPRRADARRLKRAQDTLGCLHDLQVLLDHVRQTQAKLSPPDLTMWRHFKRLVRSLEDDCRRAHARYMRERPGLESLCQRLVDRPATSVRRAG